MRSALLSVIVPAYNEEAWIEILVERFRTELERLEISWELIVVDDGSTDRTALIADKVSQSDDRVRLISITRRGKGAAVRVGLMEACGAWRFIADADLSMPPAQLTRFLSAVSGPAVPHIVIGSREASGAERIGESLTRHLVGRAFNTIVRAVAVPGVQDTQCGYKLLSADAVSTICPHLTIDGFAFDVELLFVARRAGFEIGEVGITWYCRKDSRVRIGRGAMAFVDVLRVRLNEWLNRYSRVRPGQPRQAPEPFTCALG